jgi:hypothetical protein
VEWVGEVGKVLVSVASDGDTDIVVLYPRGAEALECIGTVLPLDAAFVAGRHLCPVLPSPSPAQARGFVLRAALPQLEVVEVFVFLSCSQYVVHHHWAHPSTRNGSL